MVSPTCAVPLTMKPGPAFGCPTIEVIAGAFGNHVGLDTARKRACRVRRDNCVDFAALMVWAPPNTLPMKSKWPVPSTAVGPPAVNKS